MSKRQYLQMTNTNKQKNNTKKGNPVSFNTLAPRSKATSKIYDGNDIIVPVYQASSSFSAQGYQLNPRLSQFFPSAALQAARFDVYEFEMLEFRWVPNEAVTTTPGTIFLAFEPNPNRGVPSTLISISAYESVNSGPVYNPNNILRVPKRMLQGLRYCRNGPVAGDLNLYDPGAFIIASQGASTTPLGYVEVRYRIRFDFFHLEEEVPIQHRMASLGKQFNQAITTGVTETVTWEYVTQNFGGWSISPTAGTFRLPEGWYLFQWNLGMNTSLSGVLEMSFTFYSDSTSLKRGYATNSSTGTGFNTSIGGHVIAYSTGSNVFRLDVDMVGPGTLRVDVHGSDLLIQALS